MRTTAATYLPLGKFCASDAAASNASSERRDRCDPGPALRCYLHAGGQSTRCLHLYFLPCLPSVLPAASKAPPHPCQSVCSRPLRQGWDQSARFPGFAAAPLLVLCLASPHSPAFEGKYSDGFTT